MEQTEAFPQRAARWLAFGSAVAILFSIAASQILLALALAALLFSGMPLRLPRIKLPLALFLLGTLIAWLASGEMAAGLPQIRKIYVFCELLVVFSAMRDMVLIRWLFLTWAAFGSIAAGWGLVQFAQKVQQARLLNGDRYSFYIGERITGFMSHWNTFSAQEMFALIMLGSFLLFAPGVRKRPLWIASAGLLALAVLLAETRAVWVATAVASLYLIWFWRRWLVLLVPVLIVVVYFLSPGVIRERFTSLIRPKEVDSNEFRRVTRRTGLRMIEAHPLLGLGPEGPRYHFDDYVPEDVPHPRPEGWYGHLHNIYLQYAAERGIPTMLMMMWMLLQIIYDFWRGLRALPGGPSNRRFLLHGGIAVVLATLTEGLAEYNLGDSEVLTMFLVVVACGYLSLELDKEVVAARPAPATP
ncbi:MAG TPA: O-antigen ligase family protein [Bryobacteraceae bacterium]|nr:O-antigen ligase family protein [Bryobacteraceae bacterium]